MLKQGIASLFILTLAGAGCSKVSSGIGLDQGVVTDAGASDGAVDQTLDVEPSALQTITVLRGQMTPPVAYTATKGGQPVQVTWSVDRGEVGTIPAAAADHASFVPTGTTGGMVNVTARLNGTSVVRQVFVQLDAGSQNGADANNAAEQNQMVTTVAGLLGTGGGGVGGVGGEGLGGPVSDQTVITALGSPTADASFKFLYPYDATVWPRGMLAPLLMWSSTSGDADAIKIVLTTTSGSFKWSGTFSKPAVLSQSGTPTGGNFIRMPIPQDIWQIATDTAGGPIPAGGDDKLTVTLVIEKSGQAVGPISETWSIAPARLTGTVYYNSYGTSLVTNWGGTTDSTKNHYIGAAILGVRSGDLNPHLVVGEQSAPASTSGCRVCHIVSSRGRYLIAQANDGKNNNDTNQVSYLYDLTAPDPQGSAVELDPEGTFAWAAMTSDGSFALTNSISPSSTNPAILNGAAGTATSSFYDVGAGTMVQSLPLTGLPAGVAAGYPGYSPDDKYVAYVDATGHTNDIRGPIDIATYDATNKAFSNVQTLVPAPTAPNRVGYPAFLPDDTGIIYETEVRNGGDTVMTTRGGTRGQLWWVNTNGTPTPTELATLNGKISAASYLPIGPNKHGDGSDGVYDDTTLDYEPTVLPLIAGHYAWVVFTSRRLYGNQLTTDPWASDPQSYDLTNIAQGTTKKLWVAAIDLNAAPGTDPSHPAFYLPAQEIVAGNSRGFWVLDPCKADGASCESGDQCCNGYCENMSSVDGLVCTSTAACSNPQEKCTTAADCCDSTNTCVNGFCAASTPIQ